MKILSVICAAFLASSCFQPKKEPVPPKILKPEDFVPPRIEILFPYQDSVYKAGKPILIKVKAEDETGCQYPSILVKRIADNKILEHHGGASFDEKVFNAEFSWLPTYSGPADEEIRIIAETDDTGGNRAIDSVGIFIIP